jgi:hypothetical protein
VARHIFQACPVWIYTQSNNTQALAFLVPLILCIIYNNLTIYMALST